MGKLARTPAAGDDLFLPSFCDVRMVFVVVIIAELLAFILVLAPVEAGARWDDLGLVSLFIQWIALSSAAALCAARPALRRVPNVLAGLLAWILLLLVTLLVSELAFRVIDFLPGLATVSHSDHLAFLARNLGISAVISAVALRYLYVQHQWRQQVEAEARSRLDALQARIRPHFLFNSLNTIAALIPSRPGQAEEAVQDLADLFRASLGGRRDRVFFEEELEISRRYVHMEKLRLGERLEVEWEVDAIPDRLSLPPLVLQPLIENAIYHGVEQRSDGGVVSIRGRRQDATYVIEVSNPLPSDSRSGRSQGNRIALDNIRQRLQLAYGEDQLDVNEATDSYQVNVRIPADSFQ